MREHLLGYLLGALEEDEQRQFTGELEVNPQLRLELERLRARLDLLEPADKHHEPPAGLAGRTCQRVALHVASEMPTPRDRIGWRRGISLPDLLVAAGVFAAAALLFFPAIFHSQYQSELAFCQNNLRQLAIALSNYTDASDGYFPEVPAEDKRGVAGIYAPYLVEHKLLGNPAAVVCPSSDLAREEAPFRVPTLAEIDRAEGDELLRLQQRMGGSYGFNIGYVDGRGVYRTVRHEGRPTFAIMADAPGDSQLGRTSMNHDGRGQNVLFDDFHVEYLLESMAGGGRDAIYVNRRGQVAPGVGHDDTVVAGSSTMRVAFPRGQ